MRKIEHFFFLLFIAYSKYLTKFTNLYIWREHYIAIFRLINQPSLSGFIWKSIGLKGSYILHLKYVKKILWVDSGHLHD